MNLRIFLTCIAIFFLHIANGQTAPINENSDNIIEYISVKASDKPDYTGSLIVNKLNQKKCFCHYRRVLDDSTYQVPCHKLQANEEALFFPFTQDYKVRGRIFKIILYATIEDVKECYFKLSIYSNDVGKPGIVLFTKQVKVETDQSGDQYLTLNMVDYNFKIPNEGMFVAIETPRIPKNEVTIIKTVNDKEPIHIAGNLPDNNDYVSSLYYPYLNYMATKDLETAFYIKNDEAWMRVKTQRYFKHKSKYAKPAISLVMTK